MPIPRTMTARAALSQALPIGNRARAKAMLRPAGLLALLVAGCGMLNGCATNILDRHLLDKKVDIKNILGPTGRKAKDAVELLQRDPSAPPEGFDDYEAAKALYDQKKYSEALSAFKKIAKKYKDKAIEEDAMFMIAECYFELKKYPDAQDGYDELFKKYPSTRFAPESTRHLFDIARYWLNFPKPATQVELAHFEQDAPVSELGSNPDAHAPFNFPLKPNFIDRSRPFFDTPGRAMQALRSIWLNDPTGPLADDAIMLAATHHLRRGDYQEADHLFASVREQYGEKEHAAAAFVLGQHASYSSYQGKKYDSKQLEEARKLTDSALRLFPDLPQKKKLQSDLDRMKMEGAERDWDRVQYHLRRREKDSAAVVAEYIVRDSPDSPRAEDARKLLLDLGPEYAAGILKTPLHKPPSTPVDPYEPMPEDAKQDEPGRVHISDDAEEIPDEV